MVVFLLEIKADLTNVASITIPEEYSYCVTVKNPAGDDVRPKVFITAAEQHDLSGSRGVANFTLKWDKQAKKEASCNVVEVKNVTRKTYTEEDGGKFVPVAAFECRGMEPIEFHPQDGFTVVSTGGKVFDDVDLAEKEWYDFDEDANEQVEIVDFESRFTISR